MFVSVYMPDYKNNKENFPTEEEAWQWILENHCCEQCQIDYEGKGYYDEQDLIEINHVSQTHCGSEWLVMTKENYEKHLNGELNAFEAAGFILQKKDSL